MGLNVRCIGMYNLIARTYIYCVYTHIELKEKKKIFLYRYPFVFLYFYRMKRVSFSI